MIKHGVCNMCVVRCGITAEIEDGKLVKVGPWKEHPHNVLCPRAVYGMVDWVYSPERITTPMKKVNGDWEEISWEEAFDIFCEGLTRLKETYGAKSLVAFSGNAFAGLVVRAPQILGTAVQAKAKETDILHREAR